MNRQLLTAVFATAPRLATAGRCARWQAEVVEDLSGDERVLDEGDDPHRAAAARAAEDVYLPRPLEQRRPLESSCTAGVVGIVLGAPIADDAVAGEPEN